MEESEREMEIERRGAEEEDRWSSGGGGGGGNRKELYKLMKTLKQD